MKGLILKDFLILRGQIRVFGVVLVLYLVMGIILKDFSFFTSVIVLVAAMLMVTTCAYDDSSKWNCFARTLPLTKSKIVLSKYISSVLFVLVGMAFGVCLTLGSLVFGKLDSGGSLFTFYTVGLGSILFISCMLPLIYRFGVEKSRLLLPVLIVLVVVAIYAARQLGVEMPSAELVTNWSKFAAIPVVLLLLFSYFLSCKFYARSEGK